MVVIQGWNMFVTHWRNMVVMQGRNMVVAQGINMVAPLWYGITYVTSLSLTCNSDAY